MTDTCPNCGALRDGRFCSDCGQNRRDYLRSAYHVASEFLGEVFELDSRLFRTLSKLIGRPGYLTVEFSRGRRAHYVSPGRLYLVVSVLFFFTLSLTSSGGSVSFDDIAEEGQVDPEIQAFVGRFSDTEQERLRRLLEERGIDPDEVIIDVPKSGEDSTDPDEPASPFELKLREGGISLLEDPQRTYQNLLENLPLTMFVMLPLFAVLVKMFYPGRFLSEHLVFALHLHAFWFLAFTIMALTPEVGASADTATIAWTWAEAWDWLDDFLGLACGVYLYLAVRRVYPQGLTLVLVKSSALAFSYAILLSLGLSVLVVVTLLFS